MVTTQSADLTALAPAADLSTCATAPRRRRPRATPSPREMSSACIEHTHESLPAFCLSPACQWSTTMSPAMRSRASPSTSSSLSTSSAVRRPSTCKLAGPTPSMYRGERASFLPCRPGGETPIRSLPLRHRVRAVFLPPGGMPPPPLDDDDDDDDTAAGASPFGNRGGAPSAGRNASGEGDYVRGTTPDSDQVASDAEAMGVGRQAHRRGTGTARASSVDRVLEDTEPEYSTWVSRNRRRSLSGLRGRSEMALGSEELNESLRPGHLDRHRYVLKPDEAFGAIFSWDVVLANSRELELKAWCALASEENLPPPDMDDILRSESMAPESAIQRVFYWTDDWGEIKRLLFRKGELYSTFQQEWAYTLSEGLDEWLAALDKHGIKSALCAPRPRQYVENVVDQVGLSHVFPNGLLVTADDEFDSLEQMYLIAAIKLERPPSKCVVFTDRPAGITAGREVSSKVVALVGAHPAYEVKTADSTIANFSDLVVYNVRSLFAEEGMERMDPETELEKPM